MGNTVKSLGKIQEDDVCCTATNELGESPKQEEANIQQVKAEPKKMTSVALQLMSLVKAQNKRKQISSKSRQKEVCSDESYFPFQRFIIFFT